MEKYISLTVTVVHGVSYITGRSLMYKLIVGVFCASLSVTLYAQPQHSANQGPGVQVIASGTVYWAHCSSKCDELRCPDKKACNKFCIETKGSITMCPKAEEKAK